MKLCSKCEENKNDIEFAKRADGPWLRSHCKKCCQKYSLDKAREAGRLPRKQSSVEEKREKQKLAYKRYNAKPLSKAKQAACEARRRAQKLQATPKWLSKYQLEHIEVYYQLAAYLTSLFGIQMDVDHIIPLKGEHVKGLHVPWNMQVMVHKANQQKGNRV
jgi:hypothetical protein